MKQLLDFIPLILFFSVYKLVGIREAALTLLVATIFQVILLKIIYKKVEKQTLIMGGAVVLFASLTAYFNELEFLKWKVTIVYGLFALILLFSERIFKTNLIKTMLGKEIELSDIIWKKLNYGWAGFFTFCMIINLYISHYFSDDIWVNFKTFGILGLSLLASLTTGLYIYRQTAHQQGANND